MCLKNWGKFEIADKEILSHGFSEASENVFLFVLFYDFFPLECV